MEILLLVVIGVLVAAIAFLIYKFAQLEGHLRDRGQEQIVATQISQLSERLDRGLAESRGQVTNSQAIIREVTEQLTKLDSTNKQVISFADQLRSLQDILKNPKQRGVLGEYYLETLLKNVLPPGSYQMQYTFPNRTIVDAAVFVGEKIIPIDSKFSLENYNRIVESQDSVERDRLEKLFVTDLKNRILETSKYIQPDQGTTDFAFMFIPHEAIYYDLLINKVGVVTEETENLIQRAAGKYRVIIVSPTSFLAYLQTVLQGLKAFEIEKSVGEILQKVGALNKHISVYDDYMKRLGNHLGTTVNTYNAAYKEFGKIDKDVYKLTGGASGGRLEPVHLEKPTHQEE